MTENANDTQKVYTVGEWLFGCVNFAVPDEAVNFVCKTRNLETDADYKDYSEAGKPKDILRLAKADLFKWIVLGAGKVNNTTDTDNGWSHSEGGYTLSQDDKKLLMDEANGIYEELEPESVFGKKKIRMRSAGIMPAYRDTDGTPLPRRPI